MVGPQQPLQSFYSIGFQDSLPVIFFIATYPQFLCWLFSSVLLLYLECFKAISVLRFLLFWIYIHTHDNVKFSSEPQKPTITDSTWGIQCCNQLQTAKSTHLWNSCLLEFSPTVHTDEHSPLAFLPLWLQNSSQGTFSFSLTAFIPFSLFPLSLACLS